MEMRAHDEEEDFIDMELSSLPPSSCHCSPQIKEFEFQLSTASTAAESAAADLFYQGKLLPLHLPPHRQIVEHLICTNSNSLSEPCRASCDLHPTAAAATFFPKNTKTSSSLSKNLKIKLNKHSYLAHKLKSSRAFLKSFFTKDSLPQTSSSFATKLKRNGILNVDHRRSFSGAIAADSATNSSSSSSSSSSFNSMSGVHELHFPRRSSSDAEIELSIDAAIAHCKKSFGVKF